MTRSERPLAAEQPPEALDGVGPVRARALAAAGFATVGDLLAHLPRRYEDRREVTEVAAIEAEGVVTVCGRLAGLERLRLRGRLTLVRGRLEDSTGALPVSWFNRPYLLGQVDREAIYTLHGEVRQRKERFELVNPSLELAGGENSHGEVVPVYSDLGGMGPALVRRLFEQLVERLEPSRAIVDPLPVEIRQRHGLPPLGEALERLHRPPAAADVAALDGRRTAEHARLAYGELFDLQLGLARRRSRHRRRAKAHTYSRASSAVERLTEELPFELTGAQRRAIAEIVGDLERPEPMLRLLQGDVGSGKTAVAAAAIAAAIDSGLQVAFMAPTEILAEQQAAAFARLFGDRYTIGLLTASAPDAVEARRELAGGRIELAVGTHALIQEAVAFRRLGLAVIDEQHRFGVAQRRRLLAKGDRPDLLVMTATPIPRSLALTLYGDLDLTILDELPPGRRPPRTRVVADDRRQAVDAWLERELEAGHQAYVVMPFIEESDAVSAAAVEGRGRRLTRRLARFRPRRLHGRTPSAEREEAMARFATGDCRLLVATTLIEVGLDVPAADRMVIESAERLGLAQLHQLRGRIGRGGGDSVCVAVHAAGAAEPALRRLEIFATTSDGFELADADLASRGPGELLGTRQAGLLGLRFAHLTRDRRLLAAARSDARSLAAVAGAAGVRGLPSGWSATGRGG